jgi:hypothetical protein
MSRCVAITRDPWRPLRCTRTASVQRADRYGKLLDYCKQHDPGPGA